MTLRLLPAALALVAAACASAPKSRPAHAEPAPPAPAPAKVDLDAMAARELPEMARQAFASADGALSGEVEGAGPPKVESADAFVSLSIPLRGATDLTCFVYRSRIDPGGTFVNLIKRAAARVELQAVRLADVVPVQDAPALFLEALYLMPSEKGPLAGQLKAMILPDESSPVMCLHDELGYRATFQRIALGLAKQLKAKAPAASARYVELSIVKVGSSPAGFRRLLVADGPKGGAVVSEFDSILLSRSPKDLLVEDSALVTVSDKAGLLASLEYAKSANGELESQISATRGNGGEYGYKGKLAGKDIAGKFRSKAKDGLPTDLGVAKALRKLLAGKAAEAKLQEYHPAIDPTAPVETVYRKSDRAPRAIDAKLGELTVRQTLDDQGLSVRDEMALGPVDMAVERVYSRGAP